MDGELVHLRVADGVATITLDSPRNRNALSARVCRELQGFPQGMLMLGAPQALAATKELLRRPLGDDLDAAFDAMQQLSAHHFASAEGQEGMTAFAEKRPPTWARQ